MIATITKKVLVLGDEHYAFKVTRGTEVDVYEDRGSTLQVQYRDPEGTLHVAYNINATWLASVVVYRRAKDLGYE